MLRVQLRCRKDCGITVVQTGFTCVCTVQVDASHTFSFDWKTAGVLSEVINLQRRLISEIDEGGVAVRWVGWDTLRQTICKSDPRKKNSALCRISFSLNFSQTSAGGADVVLLKAVCNCARLDTWIILQS